MFFVIIPISAVLKKKIDEVQHTYMQKMVRQKDCFFQQGIVIYKEITMKTMFLFSNLKKISVNKINILLMAISSL